MTDRAADLGRLLALRHRTPPDAAGDPGVRDLPVPHDAPVLHDVAESPRAGGWTLRSALVRLAQPEPELGASIVEQVRRLETVLGPVVRTLEAHTVTTDPDLALDRLIDGPDGPVLRAPDRPRPDTRMADLARLLRCGPEVFASAYGSYREHADPAVTDAEQQALPLLGVALDLDELADVVVAWAQRAPAPTPTGLGDAIAAIAARLDALGVPVESREAPRGRR